MNSIPYWNEVVELRHLRFLAGVVQSGGFSAAARALGSTQSTISKAIRQLEHDCGAPLLERLARGVRLTAAGETVLRRATAMLAEEESLTAELDALRGLETGRLSIGVPPMGSSLLFAPLLARYRLLHPGIRIDLREEGSRNLEAAVLSGEIEIGVSLLPVSGSVASHLICDEPLVAVLPSTHSLAGRSRLRLAQLDGEKSILFEQGFALNSVIESACARRGMTLTEAARSGQVDFILALVAAGLGLALLPRLIVGAQSLPGASFVPLGDRDLRWKLGLIWRRAALLSPAARYWRDLVCEHYPAPSGSRGKSR